MRPVTLTGSPDERFGQVEKILTRLIGQIPKVVTCQIPPVPLSFYSAEVPADGVVLRFIFPVQGALKRAAVLIDDMGECKTTTFEAIVHNDVSSASQIFSTNKKAKMLGLDLPVDAGMALTVKCRESVKGVWIGLLYQVHPDHAETLQLALDQMEAINARIHDTL